MNDDTIINVGCTCPTDVCEHFPKGKGAKIDFLPIHVDTSPKGIKTITIDMDKFDAIESGTKIRDGNAIAYMKFKIIENKK